MSDDLRVDVPVELDEVKVVFSVASLTFEGDMPAVLCGATAKANGWGNADLIPGVTVNRNAMARLTQLVQQGYVKISEA